MNLVKFFGFIGNCTKAGKYYCTAKMGHTTKFAHKIDHIPAALFLFALLLPSCVAEINANQK